MWRGIERTVSTRRVGESPVSAAQWWGLVGIFFGASLPGLEAVVVIPAGILAGLPVVPVVAAAVLGNLVTVVLSAWFGQRIMVWWAGRRQRREWLKNDPETAAARAAKRARRQQRIVRVMDRGGMPALALLGPLIIGTQFAAVAAVALGVSATRSFLWVTAGTVFWAGLAAVATVAGFEFLGIGG